MPALPPTARDLLTAAAHDRGTAGLAFIQRPGAEPRVGWVPAFDREPAFLAFSITKSFTAALVLLACEAGTLALDDPLARWFPRVARADRITIRHLLRHTSGIPDYGANPAYHRKLASSPTTPWPFERFAAETWERELWFEPGEGWDYSNPGFLLLKRIVESVGGASYRALVAERIARPLGLKRTFVAESLDDLADLAAGTSCALSTDRSPRDVRAHYHPGWVSHGVVASTPSDVARFFDALFRGALLAPRSLERMTEWVTVPGAREDHARRGKPSYGLGLMGDPASPWGTIAGHNGGGPCYGASVFHAADLGGVTVCAMGAIEEGFDAERLVFDVLDTLAAERA